MSSSTSTPDPIAPEPRRRTVRRAILAAAVGFAAAVSSAGFSAAPAEAAFRYHDNNVTFAYASSIPYAVSGTSYKVTASAVIGGQDPDNNLRPGVTRFFAGARGDFSFRVGRKATSTVASWWNTRVPTGRNTFGHSAGDLNFAMIGELSMTLSGGQIGDPATFQIQGAGMAQGHSGSSNNWWFGGTSPASPDQDPRLSSGCLRTSDGNSVTCNAFEVGGSRAVSVTFRRGGNDVSTVDVTSISNPAAVVTLCEHGDYQGTCLYSTDRSNADLRRTPLGNDTLSSIRVPAKTYLSLYEHIDFEGACQSFTDDVTFLGNARIGDNTVSSYRFSTTPPDLSRCPAS